MCLSQQFLLLSFALYHGKKKGRQRNKHSHYRKDFLKTLSIKEQWRQSRKIPWCALIPLKLSPWQKLLGLQNNQAFITRWGLTPIPLTDFCWSLIQCFLDTHLLMSLKWCLSSSTPPVERERCSLRNALGLCWYGREPGVCWMFCNLFLVWLILTFPCIWGLAC